MKPVGYSGTPLAKKLGIKSGFKVLVLNSPQDYLSYFSDFPEGVEILSIAANEMVDIAHIFATTWEKLEQSYTEAMEKMKINGMMWISWPKKSAGIHTEVGKMDIMKYGLDNGLVDVKVAAIDENWSGLKFVYRLKDRK